MRDEAGSRFTRELRRRSAINAKVFTLLEECGDDLNAMRQVSHWAYFPNKSASRAFAQAVKQLGYRAMYTKPYPYSDTLPFGVHFLRTDSVRPVILNAICAELAMLADRLGGEYDGWETEVGADN